MNFFKIQKFDLLVSVYIFSILVAEIMGGKTIPFIHWGPIQLNTTIGIFVFPLIFTINDIITEVYGKERTKSIVRAGLLMIFLLFLFTILAVHLPPSERYKTMEPSFDKVFSLSARISLASLTAFALAEFFDVYVFTKLRQKLGKKGLWLRNNISNFAAQLVDTIIFMTLAFYAFDHSFTSNLTFLWSLILPYWLIKCGISIIETPVVYLGVQWLKGTKSSKAV